MYDFLIVGSGFFGSICARELTDKGFKCLVIESRNHIGGNCYTEKRNNINLHMYGPHIFHTSDDEVWHWINKYTNFNNFILKPVANFDDEIFSLPFNMFTFSKLWDIYKPEDAKKIIELQSKHIIDPKNLEEQSIKLVGTEVYEKLIKGYTTKQWGKDPKFLPKEIIQRLPVRFTYDNNYFDDKYQGIPIGGYTKIFEKLLDNIEVKLETNYFNDKDYFNSISKKIIYTGPIDKFYDYKFGSLEYKTTKFSHKKVLTENYQGTAMMNFTSLNVKHTRIIEHKHFENSKSDVSWVTFEYPEKYIPDITEPYYPVNDHKNNLKYYKYKKLSENQNKIFFGGRLAEYKYYDMHKVIRSALNFIKKIITNE